MKEVNLLFEKACQALSYLGQVLIDDDAHDFGWFTYYDRPGHPDHPSPLHHWQVGVAMVFIGEAMKAIITLLDALGMRVDVFFNQMRGFLSGFAKPRLPLGNQVEQLEHKSFEQLLGEMYSRRGY